MELEFKFGFDPEQELDFAELSDELLARSFTLLSKRRHRRMCSHYYLVKAQNVSDEDAVLCRLRAEAGTWVLTLKSNSTASAGFHQRQEYELRTSLEFSEAELSPGIEIRRVLDLLHDQRGSGDEALKNRCLQQLTQVEAGGESRLPLLAAFDFERESAEYGRPEFVLELAVDRGCFADNRAFLEIEFELKSGDAGQFCQAISDLAETQSWREESRSKFERGRLDLEA